MSKRSQQRVRKIPIEDLRHIAEPCYDVAAVAIIDRNAEGAIVNGPQRDFAEGFKVLHSVTPVAPGVRGRRMVAEGPRHFLP